MCLKRHGKKLFIRNLGQGRVRIHGKQIEDTTPLADVIKNVEREAIQREIRRQKSVRDAARILGMSEGYLYRKMKKLGVKGSKRP